MTEDPNIGRVAREFSRLLIETFGRKKVAKMVRLNRVEPDPGVCHSHDFCDANMVMMQAHVNLDLNPGVSQGDVKLWNDAWSLAKKNGFFLK